MKSKAYREAVIDHMIKYKKEFLGITDKGIYKNSSKDYGHILPNTRGANNVPIFNLLPTIDIKSEVLANNKLKYHQYAHHLNSSQMMCLNFFIPIMKDKVLLDILREVTTINITDATTIETAEFEKIVSGKDNTNFDFYLKLSTGETIYFEIKYTEKDFGGNCFQQGKLKDKYEVKYKTLYEKELKSSLMKELSKEEFFKDYQINRNLSYIKSQKDYVLFILPFDSEDLYKDLINVTNKNNNIKGNISIVDWKKLCDASLNRSKNNLLFQHYRLFQDKYLGFK